ncbi:MAG: hypothetical protein ABIP39_02845 [Polyangiaceae bacterium]
MGPRARTAFAAAYLALQMILVTSAGSRPDHAFGFRMFSESSTLNVALFRRIDAPSGHGTIDVHVEDGTWIAKDADGAPQRISWRERVRDPGLSTFDTTIHASYGADAQVERLQAALDDVAAHIPHDTETRALVLQINKRSNGREPVTFVLEAQVNPKRER